MVALARRFTLSQNGYGTYKALKHQWLSSASIYF